MPSPAPFKLGDPVAVATGAAGVLGAASTEEGAKVAIEEHRPGLRRTDWTREEVAKIFDMPFLDLGARAHRVHGRHHPENVVQLSTLLSIKTGGCPEDCGYCRPSTPARASRLRS
jgi:biotin synthase-like enzyme